MAAERTKAWYPDIWLLQETGALTSTRRRLLSHVGSTCAVCCQNGRGLAVVASTHYDLRRVHSGLATLGHNTAEYLCVDVCGPRGERYRLLNVYLRPGSQLAWTEFFSDIVATLRPDVIGGDFNARHESWDTGTRLSARDTFARGDAFLRALRYARMTLSSPTSSKVPTTIRGSSVDLFLYSESITWFPHEVHCEFNHPQLQARYGTLSDHFPVVISVTSLGRAVRPRGTRQVRWDLLLPTHKSAFRRCLQGVADDPQVLHDTLCRFIRHLPRSSWNAPPTSPFTIEEDYYDATTAWRAYRRLRVLVPPTVPLQAQDDFTLIFGARAKAAALNRLFAAKHSAPESQHLPPVLSPDPLTPADVPEVTLWEVTRALRKLKTAGSADNDGISPRLLQWCPEHLARCLRPVFTTILRDPQRIPEEWKSSVLVPLPKEGKPPHLLTSQRPICIYSLLSRVMETVVAARILSATSRSSTFDKCQYGFRPGHSPEDAVGDLLGTALLVCETTQNSRSTHANTRSTSRSTRVPGRCLVGYLDLSDAFCRVPHVMLLAELRRLAVPPYLVRFVHSWLRGRRARTFFQGRFSDWADLPAGVPQGSVLGPLLFTVFINLLVSGANTRLQRQVSQRANSCVARVVAYVDDITILVGGYAVPEIRARMASIVQFVLTWCAAHNMVLSPKSVFQWLSSKHLGLQALLNEERATPGSQDIVVHLPAPSPPSPSGSAPPPRLGTRDGRLFFGAPTVDVRYPTMMSGAHRFLGILVDCGLNFSAHVEQRSIAGATFLSTLEPVLARCHPRVGRSMAFAVASQLTYGLPLLNIQLQRVLGMRVTQLRTVWYHTLRVAGHITRTAASVDTVIEMGCPTLDMIIAKQAIAYNRRRSTHPRVSFLLYGLLNPDPPGTDKEEDTLLSTPLRFYTHTDQQRSMIDPFIAFGHRPVPDLMPFIQPPSPPPLSCDRVRFLVPDSYVSPKNVRQRLEANCRSRLQANAILAGLHVIEGWSDGGYSCSGPPESRVEKAGGAAVVFQQGESHTRTRSVVLASAAPLACSYTAEIAGALALLPLLLDAVAVDAAEHPHIGVLICADSRSWMEHARRGPQHPGPIAPLIWAHLLPLVERVDLVLIVHMYAHCGDPRGDVVDTAATESRDRNTRAGSIWNIDSSRHAWAPTQERLIGELMKARSSFHRLIKAPVHHWAPSPHRLPPRRLRVRQACMILQLRTGFWPSLGAHTFIRSYAHDWTCPRCEQQIAFTSGGGVRHILTCSKVSGFHHVTSDLLWSPLPPVLRQVIARSRQWGHQPRSRSPSEASIPSPTEAD